MDTISRLPVLWVLCVFMFCHFRQPCKQTTYSHRVYQSPWPHESYQLSFYCRHIKRQDPMCWKVGKLEGQTYLGQHFTKYTEALGTLYYEDISQTYEKLLKEDLLQRNFIQLKVNFLVCISIFFTGNTL